MALASLHPHDHAAAGDAKSLVPDAEAVRARLVGSSDHRRIEYWRGFVYQASAIALRSGRPSGSNHVFGSSETISALVKRADGSAREAVLVVHEWRGDVQRALRAIE